MFGRKEPTLSCWFAGSCEREAIDFEGMSEHYREALTWFSQKTNWLFLSTAIFGTAFATLAGVTRFNHFGETRLRQTVSATKGTSVSSGVQVGMSYVFGSMKSKRTLRVALIE